MLKNDVIREVKTKDLSRTAEIHVYGWRNAYKEIIAEKELYIDKTVEKTIERHQKILDSMVVNFTVYDDNIIKAFMIHGKSRDFDKPNSYELCAIYTEPNYIGKGIGEKLLKYFEEYSLKENRKELIIWILEKNTLGRKFFEDHGYRLDGSEKIVDTCNLNEVRYYKML